MPPKSKFKLTLCGLLPPETAAHKRICPLTSPAIYPTANSKAAAGRAKKQDNADKKAADAAKKAEAAEAADWDQGAKGKSTADAKAEKAAEAARKKAERERLLAEEEASLPKPQKAAPKAGAKKAGKAPAGPPNSGIDDVVTSLSASNINDALDAMDFVAEKTSDKAAMGSKAAQIDSHPERRFKAAFEAWKEAERPRFKEENPGLRKTQLDDIMYKAFQKAPENPFNQLNVAYDADKETKLELLQKKREEVGKRLGS